MNPTLVELSEQLAATVQQMSRHVVAVHARPRLASSGLLWRDRTILTADHTLTRTERIAVTLPSGESVPATVAGRDPATDLALLRVEGEPGAAWEAAPSASVGTLALTIGRSGEHGPVATLGVVSTVSGPWRTWRGGQVEQLVRLDAPPLPGLSGASAWDAHGRLLGLVTTGLSRHAAVVLTPATLERVAGSLLQEGRVRRAFLGVSLQQVPVPASLKQAAGLDQARAVMLLSVEPDSPAERAGLLLGDVLVSFGGEAVTDPDDLHAVLAGVAVGEPVPAIILRGGERREVSVVLGERPQANARTEE